MNIIITGGASGLGRSISEKLLQDKTNSFLISYKTESELINQWTALYPQVKLVHCDFADDASLDDFLKIIDEFSPDVIINNAHTACVGEYFHKMDSATIKNSFCYNVLATLKITGRCISIFRKKKAGRIINILSSFIICNPPKGWSVYTAEKAYLLSMSKSWAVENAAFKIVSNSVSPEFMLTKLTSETDERIIEQMIADHPLKKLLATEEVAEVVEYFTRCSLHINGTNFPINSAKNGI